MTPGSSRRTRTAAGSGCSRSGSEGAVDRHFLKVRVALPLFFERALIEITPRRVLFWSDGDTDGGTGRDRRRNGGRVMRHDPELDARTRPRASWRPTRTTSSTWVDDAGYPVSVAVDADQRRRASARFDAPAGLAVPTDREVSLTGSHIRPQPGYGYDERRHVTVWGRGHGQRRDGRPASPATRVGLGRGRGPVLRVLRALRRPVAALLRRAVGRARDAGQAAAVVRLPGAPGDPPAVPDGDDRAGPARHPDRRLPRLLRPDRRRC